MKRKKRPDFAEAPEESKLLPLDKKHHVKNEWHYDVIRVTKLTKDDEVKERTPWDLERSKPGLILSAKFPRFRSCMQSLLSDIGRGYAKGILSYNGEGWISHIHVYGPQSVDNPIYSFWVVNTNDCKNTVIPADTFAVKNLDSGVTYHPDELILDNFVIGQT